MYYYFPEQEGAYPVSMDENLGQNPSTRHLFFGDALLIAPVTAASTASTCVQSPEPELSAAAVFVSASGSRGSAYPPASRSHDAPCGLTEMDVWLPPGSWFEIHTGQLLSGSPSAGTNRSLQVHLDDVPVYAKGGSVVPRRPLPRGDGLSSIGLANAPYESLSGPSTREAPAARACSMRTTARATTTCKAATPLPSSSTAEALRAGGAPLST